MELKDALSAHSLPGRGSAVCVGTFDGVHLGHRALLNEAMRLAESRSLASVAIAFRQQPRSVIHPDQPTKYLCPLDERLELLGDTGVDAVVPVDFTEGVRNLRAAEFLRLLMGPVGLAVLVIGPGARQGRDQLGVEELVSLGREMGFEVAQAAGAAVEGVSVSSSAIRDSVERGCMGRASAMLGRDFSLSGTVVEGSRRGRTLGYPTANLSVPPGSVLPMDGIYAARASVEGGGEFLAAVSVGVRPTFGSGERIVEAFLLDFAGSIYGRGLRLRFVRRLRDEAAFGGASELVRQIGRDVEETRALLGGVG